MPALSSEVSWSSAPLRVDRRSARVFTKRASAYSAREAAESMRSWSNSRIEGAAGYLSRRGAPAVQRRQRGVGLPRCTGKSLALCPAGAPSGTISSPPNGGDAVAPKVSVPSASSWDADQNGSNTSSHAASPM